MAPVVTIAGTARTDKIEVASIVVTRRLGARTTCGISTLDPAVSGMYRPAVDDTLVITDGGTTYFGGLIDEVRESPFVGLRGAVVSVNAGAYDAYADWRAVKAEAAAGQTLKQVVTTLVSSYLSTFGVTLDAGMASGPTLGALTWDYRRLTDVFQDLALLTGWVWWIDGSKVLHWQDGASGDAAPFTITESTPYYREGTWSHRQTRADYRNRQYVRYGSGDRWIDDEQHGGDGSTRTFALTAPAKTAPTSISISRSGDGTETFSVGIHGVDDMPWTYRASDNSLVQRVDQTVLGASDVLHVPYQATYPAMASDEDAAEIAAHGPREWPIVEAKDTFDAATAIDLAEGLLRRYAKTPPRTINFETFEPGLVPGQILSVNLPTSRGIASATFLITELRHVWDDVRWVTTVTAVEGTEQTTEWDALYKTWGGGGSASAVSAGGGSAGGSAPAAVAPVFLGGSSSEAILYAGYTAVPHQLRLRLRDTWFAGGRAVVRVLVKVASGGSLTARLYNYTAASVAGTSPASSSTTWVELTFTVDLASGLQEYGLELTGDGTHAGWILGTLGSE